MYRQEQINPYGEGKKVEQVELMFDNIAHRYDLLNHMLSLGIDRGWRREAIDSLLQLSPQRMLDIATGTGDFAILAAERLHPAELTGCDISEGMMAVARKKVESIRMQSDATGSVQAQPIAINFRKEDCENLSFSDNTFDAVTVAYGIRNFAHLEKGLAEMLRVLRKGGQLLIVELTAPRRFPMKQLFWLYSHIIIPIMGRIVSGDSKAYTYLPATMEVFPQGEQMQQILKNTGFTKVTFRRFTFGICTMYLATK